MVKMLLCRRFIHVHRVALLQPSRLTDAHRVALHNTVAVVVYALNTPNVVWGNKPNLAGNDPNEVLVDFDSSDGIL